MGPDDYLMMFDAYKLRREEDERELYLLRHIAYVAHNAVSGKASRLSDPQAFMTLSIDPAIEKNRKKRVQERKNKSDELFKRARERGILDDKKEE